MIKPVYILASPKEWHRDHFQDLSRSIEGDWYWVRTTQELLEIVDKVPKYVFFFHWSDKVKQDIIRNFECVCFHMTDVPYGRGGSPLQNLIIRGHRFTKLTALQMTNDFDTGPVYQKRDLSLDGSAQDIYVRAGWMSVDITSQIIKKKLTPHPQEGQCEVFKRRHPKESKIIQFSDLEKLYDFIRMLDADGYPKAFINYCGYRIEFKKAKLEDDSLSAQAIFTVDNLDE